MAGVCCPTTPPRMRLFAATCAAGSLAVAVSRPSMMLSSTMTPPVVFAMPTSRPQ
jgi:hypothetical protein